ncbi:hypothetical protein GDO78_010508 [Eleutherodactylus coqui]|uniref:Uncharacterized protein n=1 Tax=Eleutherodactylus coqui TaxID=57060 RepID=A0A8J6F6P4_ELECQ|nr:hypothetical protein GDO78_010508 [Eleutherodactylus coqui]
MTSADKTAKRSPFSFTHAARNKHFFLALKASFFTSFSSATTFRILPSRRYKWESAASEYRSPPSPRRILAVASIAKTATPSSPPNKGSAAARMALFRA